MSLVNHQGIYIMKILISFVIIVFAVSCASSKKKSGLRYSDHDMDGDRKMEVPNWVYAPDSGCSKQKEICASGEGESLAAADANAKKALGSIFETKIKSTFELQKSSFSDQEAVELSERVYSEVTESVDIILKGVSVTKRALKDNLHFSLVALDKIKASATLRNEIRLLDDQIDHMYKQQKKSSIIKMLFLFDKREMLNDKYTLINGLSLRSAYSFSKIDSIRFAQEKTNRLVVKAVNEVPRTLKKWIEGVFTNVGYKLTKTKNKDFDYMVKLKYFAKEEFLKVKGFKKYSFSIIAEGKNNVGDKLGVLNATVVGMGRNQQDAFLKVKEKLKTMFENKLDTLNLK